MWNFNKKNIFLKVHNKLINTIFKSPKTNIINQADKQNQEYVKGVITRLEIKSHYKTYWGEYRIHNAGTYEG